MIVGLTSDTHLGLTKISAIRRMFLDLRDENPDIIVHCGDYSGGKIGHEKVKLTCELMREIFPDTPIISVTGNHCKWSGQGKRIGRDEFGDKVYARPHLVNFQHNESEIVDCFKKHRVHFLDNDGVYRHPGFPCYAFVGHTGWYHKRPNSNDFNFMPMGIEGDTHYFLLKMAENELMQNLQGLTDDDVVRILVTHFPVIDPQDFGWSEKLGKILQEQYGISYFLNGHAHQRHNGPLRFESGSDYYLPRYLIMNI